MLKNSPVSWWIQYKKYVRSVVLVNESEDPKKVSYWRNTVFCAILTYLAPLSLIALVPGVIVAYRNGFPVIVFMDILAFIILIIITLVSGIKLKTRKSLFIFTLYCLSLILLAYLPIPGPGLLFMMTVTLFSSLIFSSAAAYFSAWTNTAICIIIAIVIYLRIDSIIYSTYDLENWIAISSNLVLLSFICAKCLDLLHTGLNNSLEENRIAEIEREKLVHDLLQRNRDLEQFTFIISHNMRAPTANIIGITEYLQDETNPKELQKELLDGLTSSVTGLDNIIKDINSILQLKHEKSDKKEKIVFSKLVSSIKNSIANTIEKHNVRIKCDFTQVDTILSLKVYMHSIFYNLISNSIKYRKPDEQPLIEIKSKLENGNIILTFKDNGLGIDLKTKGDKVFGLYNRFHSHVEGKGMGLFMVKTQVESVGGKISIESEPNVGTVFTIVFEN